MCGTNQTINIRRENCCIIYNKLKSVIRQLPTAELSDVAIGTGKPVIAGTKYSKRWHRQLALFIRVMVVFFYIRIMN